MVLENDYGKLKGRMTRSPLICHIGSPSEPTETGHVQNFRQNKTYQNFETSISQLGPQSKTTCKISAMTVNLTEYDS